MMTEDRTETPRGRRPVSAAPYPENDPSVRPSHPVRPNSPCRQGLRPTPGPAADRPVSAFGIRTDNPAYGSNDHVRPASTIGNMSVPQAGRGNNLGVGRPLSAWDAQQPLKREPSPGPPGRPPKQPLNKQAYPQQVAQNPAMGHGYDQPQQTYNNGFADMSNVAPRTANKLTRPDRHSSLTPNASPGGQVSPRLDSMPAPNRAGPRPLRASATPDSRQSSVSSATMSPPSAPPKVNEPSKAAAPKKPGPATFEEMGIPQVKDQSECVVM